jgi:hypothetical protein
MNWTRSEIMSALALVISALGFVLSLLSFRRTWKLEEPNAWLEIKSIGVQNCWIATVQVRNPTKYELKLGKIGVPIKRVPVDDKQDFVLGDYEAALKECGNDQSKIASAISGKDNILSMEVPMDLQSVPSGGMGTVHALLFRGRLSTASDVVVTLSYLSMEETPRPKICKLRGRLADARKLQIVLARV